MMDYGLIVIGAGPGGTHAARVAAKNGIPTALIEAREALGGTCLNIGCIPSKTLLNSTAFYQHIREHGEAHGLKLGRVGLDLPELMRRKSAAVAELQKGLALSMGKVKVLRGRGSVLGPNSVQYTPVKGKPQKISADHILLATGSSPIELPFLPFDKKLILSSEEALSLKKIPRKLVVIGAGAIGLELSSVWSRLGSDVSVLEAGEAIAPGFDKDIADAAQGHFAQQGMDFELNSKVTGFKKIGQAAVLSYEKLGQSHEIEANKILVAVGRAPELCGLLSEGVALERTPAGRLSVDAHFQTSVQGVYAIGDLIAGPMLAHKAEAEAYAFVMGLLGKAHGYNFENIPGVIYTEPELASIGLSEAAAKAKGISIRVAKSFFNANGRAVACGSTQGFAKLIVELRSDRLLGCQILGPLASELIGIAQTHIEYGGSSEDLQSTILAHPTHAEILSAAAARVPRS